MINAREGGANEKPRFFTRLVDDRYNLYLLILLGVFVIFQLVRNIWLGVHFDEANWYLQTKHLGAGYFFHPPFIVYEQFIITRAFGSSALALRLGSIFFTTSTLLLVFTLAREMFKDTRLAFYSTLLLCLLPITMIWMVIGFQEAPYIFFLLLSTLFVWRAISSEKKAYWYLAGISAGFLLLCKLEATLFFAGLLLFLAASKKQRHWLRTKEPYLGFLIVLLMFTPTIIWYASRGFEPIVYQLTSRPGFLEFGVSGYIVDVMKHVGWEIIVLSFFVYLLSLFGLFYGGYLALRVKDTRFQLLFWISAVYIVFFTITAGPPYWSWPGHALSLIMAVCAFPLLLSETSNNFIKKLWRPAFVVLCLVLPLVMSIAGIYLYTTTSILHNGWEELAEEVREVKSSVAWEENPYLASPYFWISSEMGYYLGDELAGYTLAFRVYENNLFCDDSTYSPWIPLDELAGTDMIFIDEKDNPDKFETPVSYWVEKLEPYFDSVDEPVIFTEERNGEEWRTFYIFVCRGFAGPDPEMDDKGAVRDYTGIST